MSGVGTLAAWLLAVVFAWTGAAKLARRRATAVSFRRLGLPAAPVLVVVVTVAEMSAAALLVARPAAGGVVALGLLLAFSAVVASGLRSGATVACGCFGGSSRTPLSAAALVRNALLAVGAAAALTAPTPAAPALPDVLVVAGAAAAGMLAHALAELRAGIGRLWDNRLETGPGAAA